MNSAADLSVEISGYSLVEQLYSGSKTLVDRAIRELNDLSRESAGFREQLRHLNQEGLTSQCSLGSRSESERSGTILSRTSSINFATG